MFPDNEEGTRKAIEKPIFNSWPKKKTMAGTLGDGGTLPCERVPGEKTPWEESYGK